MQHETTISGNTADYTHLLLEVSNKIGIISLNNPPANSLKIGLLRELDHCIKQLVANPSVKVIIIASAGKSFACGADIEEMSKRKTSDEAGDMSRFGQQVLLGIENSPKPVIAAVHGFCLGGGLELVLSCHVRIASDRAVFGMPEIHLGMTPAFGGSYRLPLIIGRARAIHMILTAEKLLSAEAYRIGLVSKVVVQEHLLSTAKTLAGQLAEKSSMTMRMALASINNAGNTDIQGAMQFESAKVEELYNAHDLREGVFAYLEKRKPDFQDF
jgi:enoyl-CoA hydratase/carnithine racemase